MSLFHLDGQTPPARTQYLYPERRGRLRDAALAQKKVVLLQTQAENGGAQEISRRLATGLSVRGCATRQVFLFQQSSAFEEDENTYICAPRRPQTAGDVARMLLNLYRYLRREAPESVITLQHYGNVIGAPIARALGVRHVVANQLSSTAVIPKPVRWADRLLGSLGFYDSIVINSAATAAAYADYPRAYSRRLTRIDHGFFDKSVAMPKADARASLGLPQGVELLGCAARLSPLKQLDAAIRLLTLDPDQRLALAGQGPERVRLEDIARELGVFDRVHFLGELGASKMGVFYAAIDCFVFPSAAETFGLAPVEAAQAGAPTVVNDIDTLREVLSVDGKPCALLVDAADTTAFAAAVRRVLDDRALSDELRARGGRLHERFPLNAMIDGYYSLLA